MASHSEVNLITEHFARLRKKTTNADAESMIMTSLIESPLLISELLDHIHERTFGRLHDLNVAQTSNGRVVISAVAHSRFVGQLAEWAVLERVAPADVDLDIQVAMPTRHFTGVQK